MTGQPDVQPHPVRPPRPGIGTFELLMESVENLARTVAVQGDLIKRLAEHVEALISGSTGGDRG